MESITLFLRSKLIPFACILACCQISCEQQVCSDNSTAYTPIEDLENGVFRNYPGGLYPGGSNRIPVTHFTKGIQQGAKIRPLDANGMPDSAGNIGLLTLGYSTTAMTTRYLEYLQWIQDAWPHVRICSAAQAGQDINSMIDEDDQYWENAGKLMEDAGLTHQQVQVIWLCTGDMEAFELPFPDHSVRQLPKYTLLLQKLSSAFPNLQIVFLSDRTYGGYITENGARQLQEPSGYFSSWTVKWIVEQQISGTNGLNGPDIPFIDWGVPQWTNGAEGNRKGYKWECEDAGKGGIHPSSKGRAKEATRLFLFLDQHPYLYAFHDVY